jgi:hypothetical protein
MARVGVCTRPADHAVFSLRLFRRFVNARVAFMPISQSDRARQAAASARPCSSSPGRRLAKPSRIAPVVIDCSHSRRVGLSESR